MRFRLVDEGRSNCRAGAMESTMMNRLASAAAIVMLVGMAPTAHSAASKRGPSARFTPTVPADATTVTNYYKQSVYDPSDNKVGDIVDLMVEKDGRIAAAMVGVGGFLGVDEKNVAVPFDTLAVSHENNQRHLTLNATKDALKNAPGFKYDRDTTTWVSDKSVGNAEHKFPLLMGTMPRE
jgi:PRC-barrel domain